MAILASFIVALVFVFLALMAIVGLAFLVLAVAWVVVGIYALFTKKS